MQILQDNSPYTHQVHYVCQGEGSPIKSLKAFFLQRDMRHSTPKKQFTSPKANLDTQHDGLEKVIP